MTVERTPGGDGDVDLPRQQSGNAPQHLLTTLFGEFWLETEVAVPSAALVSLVGEFGVAEGAGRAALGRLARRGLLVAQKRGRVTFYGLAEPTRAALLAGSRRIAAFGLSDEARAPEWTIAAFSLPEAQRDIRYLARRRLRWLGFAPLFDGMWVSPAADPEATLRELTALGVGTVTVLRATELPRGSGSTPLLAAWDLDGIRAQYAAFLERHRAMAEAVERGDVGAARALIYRTSLMDEYRGFPSIEPGLPDAQMPPEWPRAIVRERFAAMYDALGELAGLRVRQILEQHGADADVIAATRHHSLADMLDGRFAR